jgi:diguanylate cyclase (GGDEF)-like protein/PAS domain S-box-containing protein
MSLRLVGGTASPPLPSLPSAAQDSARRFEQLLITLTAAAAPLMVACWLLLPSRAPLLALTSQLIVPLYVVLAGIAVRRRSPLLARGWFQLVLFTLQAALIFVQIWAYERPDSPLWIAFLPVLLVAAARWEFRGVWLALAFFCVDRIVTLISFRGLATPQLGEQLTLEFAVTTLFGVTVGFFFHELARHGQRLRASTASLAAVLDNVGEAVLTVDDTSRVASANRAAGELFGYDPAALRGCTIDQLLTADGMTVIQLVRSGGRSHCDDASGYRQDGTTFIAEVVATLVVGDGGSIRVLVLRDVTELREQTAVLSHQALHDGLTGLPNRTQFTDALLDRLALARKSKGGFSVLLLDMDNFKEVNDTRGHHVGDELLKAAGQRLRDRVRESDLVARVGGDEFALLTPTGSSLSGAQRVAEKILQAFEEPFCLGDDLISTGVSVGIATFPDHGEDADSLMRRADAAMYAAKYSGRGWAVAAPKAMRDGCADLVSPADLRRAVEDDELELRCTPVMALRDHSLRAVDARVRWQHPELGLLEAERFMPLAERSEVIRPLIRSVVRMAVEQQAKWRDSGGEVPIGVLISPRNLRDRSLISTIAELLRAHNLPTGNFTLLAGESAAFAPGASEFFAAAVRAGLRVGIDDYGFTSGALLRLRSSPFTEIRLDAGVTGRLTTSPDDANIMHGMVELAHAMGMTVTAKGVCDEPTLHMLQELDCDAVTFLQWNDPLPSESLGSLDCDVFQAVLGVAGEPADRDRLQRFPVENLVAGAD